MGYPVLIDTDMGVDDALALLLAYSAPDLDIEAICAVGGNVDVQQAYRNVWRVLGRLRPPTYPVVVRGLDQPGDLIDARDVYGQDGLGEIDLPAITPEPSSELIDTYERMIKAFGEDMAIVTLGPLTNLAEVNRERPGLLERVGRLVVMGGAIWTKGNMLDGELEFNFYRDPAAAAEILALDLPIRIVPLDVTRQFHLDESHLARLSKSIRPEANFLAEMLSFPMAHSNESPPGTCLIHDALAISTILWPELFLETEMRVDVQMDGPSPGKTVPALADSGRRPHRVVISVEGADYLERFLGALCQETFV